MTCPCNSRPCVCPAVKCTDCNGRGWFVGECHPQEMCGACHGVGTIRPPRDFRELVTAVGPLPTTGLASAESAPAPVHICDKRGCTGADAHNQTPAAAPLRTAKEVATEVVMPRVNGHPDGVDALTPALIDLCERAILADRAARPEVAEVERLRELVARANAILVDVAEVAACTEAEGGRCPRTATCDGCRAQWWIEDLAADRRGEP